VPWASRAAGSERRDVLESGYASENDRKFGASMTADASGYKPCSPVVREKTIVALT